MKLKFAFALCAVLTISGSALADNVATDYKSFSARQYSRKHYAISQKNFSHGNAQIHITEVKNIHPHANDNPNFCNAWISVTNNGRQLLNHYFEDIFPTGGKYGLFRIKTLPKPWLGFIKLGDYDGKLILIKDDGTTYFYPGGYFILSPEQRFLFTKHAVDDTGGAIEVVDLATGGIIRSFPERMIFNDKWYSDGASIYFAHSHGNDDYEQPNTVYRFDYAKNNFIGEVLSNSQFAHLKRLDDQALTGKSNCSIK